MGQTTVETNNNVCNYKECLGLTVDDSISLFSQILLTVYWPSKLIFLHFAFAATSNGSLSSLENDRNGHCHTANMKLEIYVCTGPEGTIQITLMFEDNLLMYHW